PAAIARAPAELDERLAPVELPGRLGQSSLEPRLSAHVTQVGAHAVDVDRRTGDEEDCRSRLVHRADDATYRIGRPSRLARERGADTARPALPSSCWQGPQGEPQAEQSRRPLRVGSTTE